MLSPLNGRAPFGLLTKVTSMALVSSMKWIVGCQFARQLEVTAYMVLVYARELYTMKIPHASKNHRFLSDPVIKYF
jgi:hypothetical protein